MDQIKIGKFIAQCRKDRGMTQMQLAEKLGITDRAVSKWETGKSMPDVAIISELCQELGITVNDLLSGERVSSEQYSQKLEAQVLELIGQKEISDKRALRLGGLMSVMIFLLMLACMGINELLYEKDDPWVIWVLFLLMAVDVFVILVDILIVRMNLKVGYFQCGHCSHTYSPRFSAALVPRRGNLYRKRLRCPLCKNVTWHQRVYTKPENKEDCA